MRLIDADELSKNVYAWAGDEWTVELLPYWVKEDIEVMIESAPTVEPKRGHWITLKDKSLMCSACSSIAPYQEDYYGTVVKAPRYKFCSNCGAKMDEVTDV